MIERLIEIVKCNKIEMNVDETKVRRISSQPFPVHNKTD
jgi:hypothetical protein